MTHYEVLEVGKDSSHEAIKRNYRRLVKLFHPDLNPSALAKEKILQLTEAYEVLSDPIRRAQYDFILQGYREPLPSPQVDERELHRQEYVRWKRKKEQDEWNQIFNLKVKFYKYQRYFALVFIAIGFFYSIDHYVSHIRGPLPISPVKINRWGNAGGKIGKLGFQTDPAFAEAYLNMQPDSGYLHESYFFHRPAYVSLDANNRFVLQHTIYQYNNFFAYIILGISFLLLRKPEYSDWVLTLGLVPFFLTAFLILMMILPP